MAEDLTSVEDGKTVITVTLGKNKTVVMRDLSGSEVRKLQKISDGTGNTLGSDMALASIVSIDGEKLVPVANEMHLSDRAERFSSKEYFDLSLKFSEHFREDEADPKPELG